MKKFVIGLCAAVALFWAGAVLADEDHPLEFKISLHGDYREGIKSPSASFTIKTVITNISGDDFTINVWSCGYGDTWISDGGIFITGMMSCPVNKLESITLKRRESHTRFLQVTVVKGTQPGPLTFRLGFQPPRQTADWTYTGYLEYPPVWSNPLTIKIEKWMPPLFALEPKGQ